MSAHDVGNPPQGAPDAEAAREYDSGPGKTAVGTRGIILIAAYLVILFLFLSYLLIKVWPHCEPPAAAAASESHTTATTGPTGNTSPASTEQDCKDPTWIEFFWGRGYWVWVEVRLLLLVLIAGALGALLHCFRSLSWYVGSRSFRWSWVPMYVLMPFSGSVLGLAFYFVIRGGFFPQAKADQSNPISFVAMAIVIGIFSTQATLKLKQVFETLFTAPPSGADHVPPRLTPVAPPAGSAPSPTVSGVSLKKGSVNGGEPVTISGTGFAEGVTVTFGGKPATAVKFVNSTTLTAETPAHPEAGKVDVVVTNKDQRSGTLTQEFTYE